MGILINMKIKSIYIKKLHDSYNYEINFNEDVTILYGLNGSGKTTILNIISYIISGQLYKLFNYDFDLIELCCKKVNSLDVFLFLFKRNGKRITYQINGGKPRTIILEEGMRDVEITRTEEYELKTSSEFEEISKLFNAYYLPISRVGHFSNRNERNHLIYYQRRMTYHSNKIRNQDIIYDIEGLIRDYYLNNVRKIEIANKEFRNSLLKTFTNVSNTSFEDVFIKFIKSKNNSNKIKEIQSKYIKVLKDNEIIQDHEVSAYNDFFKEFIK